MLDRAVETTDLILEVMGQKDTCHVHKSWRINERHYGALQGLDKEATAFKYGVESPELFEAPPKLDYDDKDHPRFDPMYATMADEVHKQMPNGESLGAVRDRVQTYWHEQILPTM